MADETITTERWAEIERVAAFGTPADTLPSSSALARMVEDLADEVRRMREAQANEPRAIIQAFALLGMERKLAANDGVKGGWRIGMTQADTMRWNALRHLKSLRDEVDELADALIRMDSLRREVNAEQVQDILMEAADVANFAMMIADAVGALPPTDERGR